MKNTKIFDPIVAAPPAAVVVAGAGNLFRERNLFVMKMKPEPGNQSFL